ncbi:MAG: SGNH/GDSL hydrolase family protein, partial [Sedimentisphaerales bacterium]|nr:SGNH/GDSL hydrolase family protein [Sedimentisphaerales bacterium]
MDSDKTDNAVMPNSNAIRLSGRQWLAVAGILLALVIAAPALWRHVEPFSPGSDYRIPYELSSDYWLYHRYSDWASARGKIAVIGDSVIWGHYVAPDGTLSHFLNIETASERFANLGLDGTHPTALAGLIAHYAEGLAGSTVVLHFNPLWLTSEKHDLSTRKEFHFNHPKLVPQFVPRIPCYRASFSTRLWAVTEQYVPFFSWTSHLQIAYFDGLDLPRWTLQHPYENPLGRIADCRLRIADSGPGEHPGIENPKSEIPNPKSTDVAWVTPDRSLQWRFFRHAVELLRRRECRVFVLVGPLNEHMLDTEDAAAYEQIKRSIATWLQEDDVPNLMPAALPAGLYADLSHPLPDGYARLAAQLASKEAFASVVSLDASPPDRARQ